MYFQSMPSHEEFRDLPVFSAQAKKNDDFLESFLLKFDYLFMELIADKLTE